MHSGSRALGRFRDKVRNEMSPRQHHEHGSFEDYISAGGQVQETNGCGRGGSPSQTPYPFTKISPRLGHFRRESPSPSRQPAIDGTIKNVPNGGTLAHPNSEPEFVDVTIQFVNAWDIPNMDPVGGADPYFKAELDDRISYTSTAKRSTLTPVWNEVWHVKNVPKTAVLKVKVWDKDEGFIRDDFIGRFKTTIAQSGTQDLEIESMLTKKSHGTFRLNVISNPSIKATIPPYTFAGPCRYARHRSPTVGALTIGATEERLYSTWKIHLVGISEFFCDTWQPWNQNYPAARSIFAPLSPIKPIIQNGHRLLYARTTANAFGILNRAADFIRLFRDEGRDNRIKPTIYTYIIDDDTFRFSETGAAFFVDFASKHALHSKCATQVRYSGEFHWRPIVDGGWNGFHEQTDDSSISWEIVLDNNSGTYAPDKGMLPALRAIIEYNFPGLRVSALDREDPELKASAAACRAYGKTNRGIEESEFEPQLHVTGNAQSLMHMASIKRK